MKSIRAVHAGVNHGLMSTEALKIFAIFSMESYISRRMGKSGGLEGSASVFCRVRERASDAFPLGMK